MTGETGEHRMAVEVDATRDRRPVPDQAISGPAVEAPERVNAAEPSGDR